MNRDRTLRHTRSVVNGVAHPHHTTSIICIYIHTPFKHSLYTSAYTHTTYTYRDQTPRQICSGVAHPHHMRHMEYIFIHTNFIRICVLTHNLHVHTTYVYRDKTLRPKCSGVAHPHHTTCIICIYIRTHCIYIYTHTHNLHAQRSNSETNIYWGRTPTPHDPHSIHLHTHPLHIHLYAHTQLTCTEIEL